MKEKHHQQRHSHAFFNTHLSFFMGSRKLCFIEWFFSNAISTCHLISPSSKTSYTKVLKTVAHSNLLKPDNFGRLTYLPKTPSHTKALTKEKTKRSQIQTFRTLIIILDLGGIQTDVNNNIEVSQILLVRKISQLGKEGLWKQALQSALEFRYLNVYIFNALIAACGRNKQWIFSLALIEHDDSLGSIGPRGDGTDQDEASGRDLKDHPVFIKEYVQTVLEKTNDSLLASIRCLMQKNGVKPNVVSYNAAISACATVGEWLCAENLLKYLQISSNFYQKQDMEVPILVPDIISYNSCLNAYARAKKWKRSLRLLSFMLRKSTLYNHAFPDLISFNTTISACAAAGQWKTALRLLHKMRRYNITPNCSSYGACIKACEASRHWKLALHLLRQMQIRNIMPSIACYNACLNILHLSGKWELSIRLLDLMETTQDVKPNLISYNTCLKACAVGKSPQIAVKLFNEMISKGLQPDTFSFTACLTAFAVVGDASRALRFFHAMKANNIKPNFYVYNACISACDKAGNYRDALLLLDEMKREGVEMNVYNYNACISACGKAKQLGLVLAIFHMMLDEGIQPDIVSFNACLKACENCNYVDKALSLYTEIFKYNVTPDIISYTHLIALVIYKRDWQMHDFFRSEIDRLGLKLDIFYFNGILNALDKIKEYKRFELTREELISTSYVEPDAYTYTILIRHYSEIADWRSCMELLSEMNKMGLTPGFLDYKTSLRACANTARWREALSILDEMKAHGLDINRGVYSLVIRACTNANEITSVLLLMRELKKMDLKDGVYIGRDVIEVLLDRQMWDKAQILVQEMEKDGDMYITSEIKNRIRMLRNAAARQ